MPAQELVRLLGTLATRSRFEICNVKTLQRGGGGRKKPVGSRLKGKYQKEQKARGFDEQSASPSPHKKAERESNVCRSVRIVVF